MTQIDILRPDLSALVLLPVVILFLRGRFWGMSLQHPLADRTLSSGFQPPPPWLYIPRLTDWIIILLLVGVLVQPVLPIGRRTTVVRALDLVLCVDLSASMQQKIGDQAGAFSSSSGSGLTRLDAVKQVALDFIRNRPIDRIGLVVFSANAYVVNPLTTDHHILSEYIEMMDGHTLIGEGLTSVGAGVQVSNELFSFFSADRKKGKAIIVFTDAEHNYGLKPDGPLEEARQAKTNVYFIGVGVPIEAVLGELTNVVRATGGDSFNAMNAQDLREASQQIDRLQRNPVETTEYFRNQPLYPPLLNLAFLFVVLGCALRALPIFYVTG